MPVPPIPARPIISVGSRIPWASSVAASPPAPGQLRIVGTNWRYPTTTEKITNTNTTIGTSVHTFGSGNCRNFRVRIPTSSNGNSGDAPAGPFTGLHSLEFRGIVAPLLFSGTQTRSVTQAEITAAAEIQSDALDPAPWGITEFPLGEEFLIHYESRRADDTVGVPLGTVISQDARNKCITFNSATATSYTSINSAGARSVTGGTISVRSLGCSPVPLGEFVNPTGLVTFGAFGDSQSAGSTDRVVLTKSGCGIMRATRSLDGISNPIAGGIIATPGNTLASITGANTASRSFYQYFTHGLVSIGGNDLGSVNGSTVRQKYFDVEKDQRTWWADIRVRSPGIRLCGFPKPPAIVSDSDAFVTTTGQVAGTEWGMFNGSAVGDPTGLGQYYRIWMKDQVTGVAPSNFTASINNVIMTVSALTQPGRRLYIGDVITATGYSGTIVGVNVTAADGTGSYSVSPAVPTGVTIRAFTAAPINGVDACMPDTTGATYPGRSDLWNLAQTQGLGIPGNPVLGPPDPNGSGGNHGATNHYILWSVWARSSFLGIAN